MSVAMVEKLQRRKSVEPGALKCEKRISNEGIGHVSRECGCNSSKYAREEKERRLETAGETLSSGG
jgi:hypothetical protein